MKGMASRSLVWVMVLGAGMLLGCRRAGPHAAGSGYGVGIARVNITVGDEPQNYGPGPLGVAAPSEAYIGRIKTPPLESWPQSGRIR
jgi:hypothetical protein